MIHYRLPFLDIEQARRFSFGIFSSSRSVKPKFVLKQLHLFMISSCMQYLLQV